jgi:hypothetical protein
MGALFTNYSRNDNSTMESERETEFAVKPLAHLNTTSGKRMLESFKRLRESIESRDSSDVVDFDKNISDETGKSNKSSTNSSKHSNKHSYQVPGLKESALEKFRPRLNSVSTGSRRSSVHSNSSSNTLLFDRNRRKVDVQPLSTSLDTTCPGLSTQECINQRFKQALDNGASLRRVDSKLSDSLTANESSGISFRRRSVLDSDYSDIIGSGDLSRASFSRSRKSSIVSPRKNVDILTSPTLTISEISY